MKLRDHLISRVETVVKGVCEAMRCEYDFEARFCCPPLINDPQLTEFVRGVCTKAFGQKRVVTVDQATTGDDVAYFFDHSPGCYIMVGSGNAAKGIDKPHHHPQFDFDEGALPVGVEALVSSTLAYLAK
jgi:amidohydrolase